jgi:serine/threonine-protein kinase
VDSFWIDQTEVTNKMYSLCVEAGACEEPTNTSSYSNSSYYGNPEFNEYPVIHVDWIMARNYCEWVDRRLPFEAEWEKAARGDNSLAYPWGNDFVGEKVNYCDKSCPFDWFDTSADDGFADTAPVGSYLEAASPYGALDMAGNVWEWVADRYTSTYDEDSPATEDRVVRGGSFYNHMDDIHSARRLAFQTSFISFDLGFRCAMDETP